MIASVTDRLGGKKSHLGQVSGQFLRRHIERNTFLTKRSLQLNVRKESTNYQSIPDDTENENKEFKPNQTSSASHSPRSSPWGGHGTPGPIDQGGRPCPGARRSPDPDQRSSPARARPPPQDGRHVRRSPWRWSASRGRAGHRGQRESPRGYRPGGRSPRHRTPSPWEEIKLDPRDRSEEC